MQSLELRREIKSKDYLPQSVAGVWPVRKDVDVIPAGALIGWDMGTFSTESAGLTIGSIESGQLGSIWGMQLFASPQIDSSRVFVIEQ